MRYTCKDLGAQPQTLNGICYEPNEATVEAFFLPLETLLYSSYFSLTPCLKGSHVSLPHVLIKSIA